VTRGLLEIAIALHAAGAAASFAGELRKRAAWSRAGALILAAAFVLEIAVLALLGASGAAVPVRSGGEYLLALGCFVLGLSLVLGLARGLPGIALVLPVVSAVMVAFAVLLPEASPGVAPVERSGWFVAHTTVATAGMAALAVAFAMAVLFLVKDRALKTKRPVRMLERFPSLETIDRVGFQAMLWGFSLLTLGIATGLAMQAELHRPLFGWTAKEIFPILAWLVFASLLAARGARGVSGRRSAVLAIAGFALGILTVLGMTR
jgi:ABC-type uncharacterized transport system permease subunit